MVGDHRRHHIPGAVHFHVHCQIERDDHFESGFFSRLVALNLVRQSESLFWMPDIQPGPPAANDEHFTLSNDPSLPAKKARPPWKNGFVTTCGPWSELRGIKILTPSAYLYSIMWCLLRDMGPDAEEDRPLRDRWSELGRHLWGRSNLVHGRFRDSWREISANAGVEYRPVTLALRQELLASGRLVNPKL
ncbi:uncharacterized protein DSM5745_10618 [Aspergillus mulundensis]|uniref:Uncharacterized protein n=1 Tax=Aspergillus mulundensis TaxID=1810919 RepID=A0A3D8QHH3_9EURO|nr:hypothetical protein DSM5745_10618 [Aspergillus mulundensis]RDW61120.1 hypothetical protein DSM5745_10618 [Aspergillus mulundensis]